MSLNGLSIHLSSRTCEGRLLLCTISHHDHLVESSSVALQEHAHAVLGLQSLAEIAQIRDGDRILALGQSQREATINISQHTGACTVHLNSGADDWLTVVL